jgi:hypothetical protein
MADYAHEQTDRIIEEMSKKLRREYDQAAKEIEDRLNDYLERFKLKDSKWQEWVSSGKKTESEYRKWRESQIMVGKRWASMKDQLATDAVNSNQIAQKIINNDIKDVYALGMNYSTYQIEKQLGINTSFTVYSHDTVERIMKKDPDLLPPPGKKVSQQIREGKAKRWNRQIIQRSMTQSILQGDSIPRMAQRLAQNVGDSNFKDAMRNARTMATGAENAGRIDAHDRARDMGIEVADAWVATFDARTRKSHRHLNGEIRGEDGYFSNGCRFPADPEGDPAEVYNCRCTIIGQIKGFERDLLSFDVRNDPDVGKMTYDDWLNARPKSRPIDSQYRKGEAIRMKHIRRYGGNGTMPRVQPSRSVAEPEAKPFHSQKLETVLEKNYNKFKDKVEKAINKPLYDKYVEKCKAIVKVSKGGAYTPSSDTVKFSLSQIEGQNIFSTLAHELGHMFDAKLGKHEALSFGEIGLVNDATKVGNFKMFKETPSSCDEFLSALRKDADAIKSKVLDRSIRKELLETYEKRNSSAGVQDFLDGMFGTQDDGLLPWGHGDRYYNRAYNKKVKAFGNQKKLKEVYQKLGFDASNQDKVRQLSRMYETSSEAWANVSSAVTCGGKELEAIKKYMPETYNAYLEILKKVK